MWHIYSKCPILLPIYTRRGLATLKTPFASNVKGLVQVDEVPVNDDRGAVRKASSSMLTLDQLNTVNKEAKLSRRISVAMDHDLFALAVIILQQGEQAVRDPKSDEQMRDIKSSSKMTRYQNIPQLPTDKPPVKIISLESQARLIRGLARYNPRLTPINFAALKTLTQSYSIELQSIDKALLLHALLMYGDQHLLVQGLTFIHDPTGGPIPISSIMSAVSFAYKTDRIDSCSVLWNYVKKHYGLLLPTYTTLMVDLMKAFSRNKKYHAYARKVAEHCVTNARNPAIALSIAKVAYMLGDRTLMTQLLKSPDFFRTSEIKGVILQMEMKAKYGANPSTKLDKSKLPSMGDLSAQEASGVVKAIAESEIDEAKLLVSSMASPNHKLLGQVALANSYVNQNQYEKFNEVLSELYQQNAIQGVLLNLRLKWELRHGHFWRAKRHYQNWENVPLRQRIIAWRTMTNFEVSDADRIWIDNEREYLRSIIIHHNED